MNSDVISDAILPPPSFTNQHESELESVPERWTAAGSRSRVGLRLGGF